MELSKEQQTILYSLEDYVSGKTDYDFCVLTGFAGVGKSTVLGKMVESLPNAVKVGMTAPTHKAVRILRKVTLNPRLYNFGTIHSFFGLKQNIKNGVIVYENEFSFNQLLKVDKIQVLIIDEGSMLDSKLLKSILDYKKKRPSLKLIITGDAAQLPPVGEKESLAFSLKADEFYSVLRLSLTTIMRQTKGNPILEFATDIRNNKQIKTEIPTTITTKKESDLENLVTTFFTKEYSSNPDYCKILAYTNDAVTKGNRIIRNKIFNNPSEEIIVGDQLITDKPIPISDELTIQTSEELEVVNVKTEFRTIPITLYTDDSSDTEVDFKVYKTCVSFTHAITEEKINSDILILHPDSRNLFKSWATKLQRIALTHKGKKAWREYYDFINCFAQVKYNYCLTIHKSQGSSFENVILMDNNIYEAGSYNTASPFYISLEDRNKLRYVGVTRAKNQLIII